MKLFKIFLACLLILMVMVTMIGCEHDSDSPSDIITKSSTIKYINNHRGQLELVDDWTLNLNDTIIYIQRPSCSGFESDSVNKLVIGGKLEYSFIDDRADYEHKTVTPTEIRQYNSDCGGNNERSPVYILDNDRDGFTVNIDADDNDPTVH